MSLIQRAKTAWNAFMSRAPTAENNYEPTEQTKKDEVNKSDERLA